MEYENVKSFIKAHKKEGGTTIINYSGGSSNNTNAVNINCKSIDTANLTAQNADINNAKITYANILYLMSSEGKITLLSGDDLKYTSGTINELKSENVTTNKLTVKDTATIENIINTNLTSTNITTDYLTVNKSAHFFELIIDKIRSVQGTQMNTAANCVVDYVEAYDSNDDLVDLDDNNVAYYRIYWKNTDNEGRTISNDWLVNDQAICESFNVQTGTSYDVSNKYYWRLVTATDNGTPKYVNTNTGVVSNSLPSDYNITFPNGFKFTPPAPDTFVFSDFTVTPQINGQWDDSTNTWTCTTTDFGLQLTYFTTNIDSSADQSYFICMPFSFTTNIKTMLNIGVYYSDGTFDYFPADTYKTSYSITTAEGKQIEAIIINSAVLDRYDACNWIDLSNTDMDATISGKSAIPSIGDNVCQLGYRYNNLQNPTQDDIARASAIIIAAYKTPDSEVYPPSYAQYQNITDYNLPNHRGSYFDATGAYFKGNLVAGTTIDQGVTIPVVVDSWRIIPDASFITKDQNNNITPSTINLSLLYNDGSNTQLLTTLPADKAIYVNGNLNTGGLTITVSSFNDLNILLKDSGNTQTFDKLVIEALEIDVSASDGVNGSYTQFIYKNAASNPGQPTSSGLNIPSGWSLTATTPASGEYTWMSQRDVNFNSSNQPIPNAWTTPIRLTGADGQPGIDGIDGRDGTKIEFIYKRFTSAQSFGNNNNNPHYWVANQNDDYLGPSGYEWSDNPVGITDTYKYEYVAQRTYDGETWGRFTTPVIWSKWGEKGQDGDGYEYIYKRFTTAQTFGNNDYNPAYWAANQTDEYLGPTGYQWNDDPQGVTDEYIYEYVATRKCTNGVWGTYSTPALWSHWASQGSNGGYYQMMYKNASSRPSTPTSGTSIADMITAGWSMEPTSPDFEHGEYTYMTQAFISGTGQVGEWSQPIRITGGNGKDGEDGSRIEFIYKRFATQQTFTNNNNNPAYWDASQTEDYVGPSGYQWNDNPVGVSESYQYEYVAQREYDGTTWGKFTTPVIWSKWGQKGQDGDGYEYIFKRFTTIQTWSSDNNNPNYWAANQNDEYLGPTGYQWNDDPQGVSSTYLYEYVAMRKRTNGTWGKYSTPALWSHWASQGSNGGYYQMMYKNATSAPSTPVSGTSIADMITAGWSMTATTPDFANNEYTYMTQAFISGTGQVGEWSAPFRITGDNGEDGEDGKMTEFIYKRFTSSQTFGNNNDNPAYWAASQTEDYLGPSGYEWSDNPVGITSTYKYEYVAQRTYDGTTWSKFTTPVIWSKWGDKGQDGDGYEYIYKRFANEQTFGNNNNNPAYWAANQNDEYLGPTNYQWSDNPEGVTDYYIYEYVAMRKRTSGVWGKYSTPAIWAHWSAPGTNGGHYQMMYKNAYETNPPSTPASGTSVADMITAGWTMEPTEPDYENDEYTYMTQAFISGSNQVGAWTTPIRITGENGKDGVDGTKIEFIYQRFTEEQEFEENKYNPNYWNANQTDDYLGPVGYEWNDSPEGITDIYTYEYVAERKFENGLWSKFTVPVIWSKWGDKGQDGDGVEYIFARTSTDTPPIMFQTYVDIPYPSELPTDVIQYDIIPGYPGYNTDTNFIARWWTEWREGYARFRGDFIPPSEQVRNELRTNWTDEPKGVTSEYKYEWVSMRKFIGSEDEWEAFSEPVIWSRWAEDGQPGTPGIPGVDGKNGEGWVLVPFRKDFSVMINPTDNYENIKGRLNVDLAFGIAHIDGDNITWLGPTELADYSINLITDNTVGRNVQAGITFIDDNNHRIEINGTTIPVITYSHNNYLEYITNTSTGNYVNYYYLVEHNLLTRMPTRMTVELIFDNTTKRNDYTVELQFSPSHIFSTTDAALNSVYQGLSGDVDGSYTTGFSTIKQQWDSINLSVNNLKKFTNGSFPDNNEYEQYAYYKRTTNTVPTKPSGDVTQNGNVTGQWTTYHVEPNSELKYVYYSKRTKPTDSLTHDEDQWSLWSDPVLFQVYGSNRGYVNSASLKITADGITSNVASTYETKSDAANTTTSIRQDMSTIDQKADRIGLHVDSVETDLNGVVTDLGTTGIDIEHGTITLSADNTIIDGDLDLSGDFESYNPTTQNRTRITTKRSGTSGLIMSGPDRVDQITGEPDPNTQEVDLIKMEFTTTAGARAGSIKIQSANSNNIYNNLWQESIGLSNDDNYISVRPEAITYGLRRNTYDYMKRFNNQSMSATWPAILANIVSARQITSGKWPAASINDCILTIYNGVDSDFGVVLPDPDTCAGKFYLIKNMSDESGVMTCNGGNRQLFVERSTTSKSTSVNLSDDIHFVYSDGSYWHVMWG